MQTDKPFLKQDVWNYYRLSSQVLTGSNTFRTVKFYAVENTVIKYVDIFNNGEEGSNVNYVYVASGENASGVVMGYGWAWDYHDFIHSTEFVVPAGYWLIMVGASVATYSVGFSLTFKGGLVLKSDSQTT